MIRHALLLGGLLLAAITGLRAQSADFVARGPEGTIPQHSVFDISFVLAGGQGTNFQPPAFRDFDIVGGPSIGQTTSIINGEISWQMVWTYTLLARKQGRFTIGPATVTAGRKAISTQPVTVTVGPPARTDESVAGATGDEPLMLVAATDGDAFYPGQQIVLRYKLYFRQNVHSATTLAEDDYADFFVQPLSGNRWRSAVEKVGGKDYTVQPVKVLALFAHQSGAYTIDPLVLSVGIRASGPTGMPGFFSMFDTREVNVNSEPISIRVKPLPPDAPPSFTGAVGTYEMRIGDRPATVTTDQALTFRVEMTGDGDPKRWDPPALVIEGAADVYPPRILSERPVTDEDGLRFRREIEYQVLPTTAGPLTLTLPFTYLDPTSGVYQTLGTDIIRVQVIPGNGQPAVTPPSSGEDQPYAGGISGTRVRWIMFIGIPALALLGFFIWRRSRRQQGGEALPADKAATAAAIALKALDRIQRDGRHAEPAIEATAVVLEFLCNKFGIPPDDLDEKGLARALQEAGFEERERTTMEAFFRRCEFIRYGGEAGRREADSFIDDARQMIRRLDG